MIDPNLEGLLIECVGNPSDKIRLNILADWYEECGRDQIAWSLRNGKPHAISNGLYQWYPNSPYLPYCFYDELPLEVYLKIPSCCRIFKSKEMGVVAFLLALCEGD